MPQNIYIYDPNAPVPKNVQYIEIPQGITDIQEDAFGNCFSLQSVTIPDSVTKIAPFTFNNCFGLQSIVIPDGVTEIGDHAFSSCSALQSVTIPGSVTKIGDFAFRECSGLQSVTIPDSVTEIGAYAFHECSGLRSVTIPGSVTKIGEFTFSGCSGLQSVTIPDSVTEIGDFTFHKCSSLQSVTIPDGVTKVGNSAFLDCSGLQSVTIPDSVTEIGLNAFRECSALQSVTIPGSVTKIGKFTFSGCSDLRSVTIPDSVTEIGESTFSGCSGLQSVTIPDSVTEIGDGTFYKCSNLRFIAISDSVTKIGSYAFCNCSGLQSVTIPDGVTEIGNYAFKGCSGLQSITIPDGVTEIGYYAFKSCSGLQSITIPDSVTKIGGGAFDDCSGLQSVTIPESITEINAAVFHNCSDLKSVTIPNDVTEIGAAAFAGCSALQSVMIPDSVTKIGDSAFSQCSGLQSVTIPDSVTEISANAFRDCTRLQTVTIPDSGAVIGDKAFYRCSALQTLLYKGINIAPFINIDGYGVNTFRIIKTLGDYGIPLSEHTVKAGIDMAHQGKLSGWAREYPVFGTMHLQPAAKSADAETEEYLRRLFAAQKKTRGHIPEILNKLAIAVCACGIPPERLTEAFDIEYTKQLLNEKIPIVPATACRCYYARSTCDMLIRKSKISVMAEAISLYNKSGRQECYKHLMDFILAHSDTKVEDLQYAADHAEEIPMKADTILAQVRQHRTYTENLAEVTKIEAKYGKAVPGFRLSDYPCDIEPAGITYNGMTARVLDLSDGEDIALAAKLGDLTNCCQCLGSAGETAMMHGFLNPDAGFWVIEDKDENIKAQAEIWEADGGVLVFDNIEFADTDREHLSDRVEQLRGVIAAWAMKSGYTNIIMGCGYNELGTDSMEQAPIPELRLTPEEVFALREDNDADVSFEDIDEACRYMQSEGYDPYDFVYTDANNRCVYIKKEGAVSDYLAQEYDSTLAEKHLSSKHKEEKGRGCETACK